jgi:hypothetical protein
VLVILKRALAGLLSVRQAAFAHLEEQAKRDSNLAALRAIREARTQFQIFEGPPKTDLKALLVSAPFEGIDLGKREQK